jgi:hypothetical protein
LSSNQPGAASVPASVTVPAGSTSANFTITTFPSQGTTVQLAATLGSTTLFASLGVTAAPSSPPPSSSPLPAPSQLSPAADATFSPGQAITFDWSDVAGAASYTIQIDDTQTFTAPLTVDQATTVSQFTTSTLPTVRMWWRVRANDSSGAAGTWSSSRRFEVK